MTGGKYASDWQREMAWETMMREGVVNTFARSFDKPEPKEAPLFPTGYRRYRTNK